MKNIFTFIFILGFLTSFGQIVPPGAQETAVKSDTAGSAIDKQEIESAFQPRKLKFNLEFGTTFGASKHGSYFGTYVSPHFSYPINQRFTISVGGYFSGISPINQGEQNMMFGYPYGGLLSRSYVYVEGAYRVTENLTFTGAVYKQVNLFNSAQQPVPGYNNDIRGFKMGVDYKIGDHIFIRGEVEVSNDPNPYSRSPFNYPAGNRMYDPFFNTP